MEPPVKWKTVGSILGGIAIVIALPGLIANVLAWREGVKDLQVSLPWWVLMIVGLSILAVTWTPTAWSRYQVRRAHLAKAAEADTLRDKLSESEANVSEPNQTIEVLRSLLTDARRELGEA
jgi:hypothetical protein